MKAALLALVAGVGATVVRRQAAPGNYQLPVGVTFGASFPTGQTLPAGYVVPACFRPQYCQTVVYVTQYLPSPTPTPTPAPLATPLVTTVLTPGVYTISGTTLTVTATTTILVPTSAVLTPGPNTYGGVITKVVEATTVVCPYEKTVVTNGVTTVIVATTTVVCPSAGVYTIVPPAQTSVSASTVVVYPVPATLTPGVYTRPQVIVTATVINQVIICPYNNVYTVQVYTQPPAAPAVAIAVVTPVPAPQAAPAAAPASSGPLANGNKWAITYTPYTTTGQCKSAGEVLVDLQLIASKGFASVRLYATDCSGLENVGAAARAAGLKLIIGVFIKSDGLGGAAPQVADIVRWGSQNGNFALVTMIVVGNEAVFNGYVTAVALAAFIGDAKGRFVAAGFVGLVTTTEPLNILQASGSAFCSVVDVVGANIQPFFNSGVVASQAGSFVAGQLALVAQICPGKQAYNLESGWPSAGSANGAAIPGRAEQQAAIADILAKVGDRTVFFSFTDDAWKHAGVFGVEQNFGCSGLF